MTEVSSPEAQSLIIVHGPPGAGKGTVAGRFANEHAYARHISAGDTIRAIARGDISSRNADALRVANEHGRLLADEVSSDIVLEAVRSSPDTTLSLVDGYPQRRGEIDVLVQRSKEEGINILGAICLDVTIDTSIDRMARRGLRSGEVLGDDADTLMYYRQRYERFMAGYGATMEYLSAEVQVTRLDANTRKNKLYEAFRKNVYRTLLSVDEL